SGRVMPLVADSFPRPDRQQAEKEGGEDGLYSHDDQGGGEDRWLDSVQRAKTATDPARQNPAIDEQAGKKDNTAELQTALQIVVPGKPAEDGVFAQHPRAQGVTLGIHPQVEDLVAKDGHEATQHHEVDVEAMAKDLRGPW